LSRSRTTADILDNALFRAGEPTNGNSSYEDKALEYINKIQHTVISGGHIFALGDLKGVTVEEDWVWARARAPLTLELRPSITTGSLTLTNGSTAGTFSSAPAESVEGWFLREEGASVTYRIAVHTSGGTAFSLDTDYVGTSGSGKSFRIFKLDYELIPDHIVVNSRNNKIDFSETTATTLTATLTSGTYTPSGLATEVATAMDIAGASTYTVTYSATSRKFTIASNRSGGGGVFLLLSSSGTNQLTSALPTLGLSVSDSTDAASATSELALGGIARLVEPFKLLGRRDRDAQIFGLDPLTFQNDFPIGEASQGIPKHFTKIHETADGIITVRFNRYVAEAMKVAIEHVPVPLDLQDNAASVPLIPRKYADMYEHGTAALLLIDKEDGKAQTELQLAAKMLEAMKQENRSTLRKTGVDFGRVIPRLDNTYYGIKRKRYGYTADS